MASTAGLLDELHDEEDDTWYEIKYDGVHESHDPCCRETAALWGEQTVYNFEVCAMTPPGATPQVVS